MARLAYKYAPHIVILTIIAFILVALFGGIQWQETPESTAFSRVGYNYWQHELAVVFINSDPREYHYYDVPRSVWEEFIHAESLGHYYNENIKGQYRGTRIDK